jgi:hypothetical protein
MKFDPTGVVDNLTSAEVEDLATVPEDRETLVVEDSVTAAEEIAAKNTENIKIIIFLFNARVCGWRGFEF